MALPQFHADAAMPDSGARYRNVTRTAPGAMVVAADLEMLEAAATGTSCTCPCCMTRACDWPLRGHTCLECC